MCSIFNTSPNELCIFYFYFCVTYKHHTKFSNTCELPQEITEPSASFNILSANSLLTVYSVLQGNRYFSKNFCYSSLKTNTFLNFYFNFAIRCLKMKLSQQLFKSTKPTFHPFQNNSCIRKLKLDNEIFLHFHKLDFFLFIKDSRGKNKC